MQLFIDLQGLEMHIYYQNPQFVFFLGHAQLWSKILAQLKSQNSDTTQIPKILTQLKFQNSGTNQLISP